MGLLKSQRFLAGKAQETQKGDSQTGQGSFRYVTGRESFSSGQPDKLHIFKTNLTFVFHGGPPLFILRVCKCICSSELGGLVSMQKQPEIFFNPDVGSQS